VKEDAIVMADKVLVAGGGGFIGGHLVRSLLNDGLAVRSVDIKPYSEWYQVDPRSENVVADLSLWEACLSAVDGVTAIYNLAADMGGMGFIENNKALCMLSVLTNTHLLRAVHSTSATLQHYFYSSSACVYNGAKQSAPDVTALREEDAYPADPEDGYGWEKLFSERMVRHFAEDYGIPGRIARYHNVYGPFGTWEGGREKAPAAICRKVAAAKITGAKEIAIWGDGEQTRSFLYIDDCIHGTKMISAGKYLEPVNLGSSELVTIKQLVDVVENIAGVKLKRTYDLSAPQGVRGRNSDNTLIRERYGWEPSIRLVDGLETTYGWIYDQIIARS